MRYIILCLTCQEKITSRIHQLIDRKTTGMDSLLFDFLVFDQTGFDLIRLRFIIRIKGTDNVSLNARLIYFP